MYNKPRQYTSLHSGDDILSMIEMRDQPNLIDGAQVE